MVVLCLSGSGQKVAVAVGVWMAEGSGGLRLWKGELMALTEPMELKSGRSGSERLWIRELSDSSRPSHRGRDGRTSRWWEGGSYMIHGRREAGL